MKTLHIRNLHNKNYNFKKLIGASQELEFFVKKNIYGDLSIDFSSNDAVVALNKALLKYFYKLNWNLPKKYLCPPVPGRVDYIHYVADLLASSNNNIIPEKDVLGLDIGVGANCIYPIVANSTYNWKFKCSEIDKVSILNANMIINSNESLKNNIQIIEQVDKNVIFDNIILDNDKIDFSICNPPFHKSKKEAKEASQRKILNLSKGKKKKRELNFGGQHNELWCKGGELEFITNMIKESINYKKNCLWFTTLVSKKDNLSLIYNELKIHSPYQIETIQMNQGKKQTRFIAWTFHTKDEQLTWYKDK